MLIRNRSPLWATGTFSWCFYIFIIFLGCVQYSKQHLPCSQISADFHLWIYILIFHLYAPFSASLSPSSSPLQFRGPFFFVVSIFFLHKGRELLYKPVVFPHHLLTTVQKALWCGSHKRRSSHINCAALDALCAEFWSLVSSQFFWFVFPAPSCTANNLILSSQHYLLWLSLSHTHTLTQMVSH